MGRALSEGWASEVLSRKFLKTLCRADENSKRAATMTCTGQTFHQREKGMESWGLRVSRLCFGSILNLEMSYGLFLIHDLGGKKGGGCLGDHVVFRGNNGGSFVPTGIQGRL